MRKVSTTISMTTVYDGADGLPGVDGMHSAVVQLFKRDTAVPDKPTGPLTYEFSSGLVTGNSSHFNGWSHEVPQAQNDGKKLYITMATAASTEATDTIEAHEWATPVEYVANGMHSASVVIYKRAATRPADKPDGPLTYTFATGKLTGSYFNGWSQEIPSAESNKNPCWMLHATAANTTPTDTIESDEWSNEAIMLTENGQDGDGTQYVFKLYDHELTQQERVRLRPARPQSMNEDGEWIDSTMIANGWTDDAQSPTQSLPYCYCAAIRRINGTWQSSYNTLELWSKWSKDGENGVNYAILFDDYSAVYDTNTGYMSTSFNCRVIKTEGGTVTNPYLNGSVYARIDNGQWVGLNKASGIYESPNDLSGFIAQPSNIQFEFDENDVALASISMPISIKGQDGSPGSPGLTGDTGPSIRGPRPWSSASVIYNDGTVVESDEFKYKDIVEYRGNIYECISAHMSDVRVTPERAYTKWVAADQFRFVATDLLYALWAKIKRLEAEVVKVRNDQDNRYVYINSQGLEVGVGKLKSLDIGINEDGDAVMRIYSQGQLVGTIDKNLFTVQGYGGGFTTQVLCLVSTNSKYGQVYWDWVDPVNSGSTLYQWTEGYTVDGAGNKTYNVGGSSPSQYNGALFNSDALSSDSPKHPSGGYIADGWYCRVNKGNHDAVLYNVDGQPIMIEEVYHYTSGKMDAVGIIREDGVWSVDYL